MNGTVRAACKKALKKSIKKKLEEGWYTKEKLLSYYDNCTFFAKDVVQHTYKDLVGYLNRISAKGELIKVHPGRGSCAEYTFQKDIVEKLIDEVLKERQ
jgi:hypothetical protein